MSNEDEQRKVPPLRVKISQVKSEAASSPASNSSAPSSPTKQKMAHEAKPYHVCPSCNAFRSNNLYILGRHQRSCEKKKEEGDTMEETNVNEQDKAYVCQSCNVFKSNNFYIFGRHQRSCEKKMGQQTLANNTAEADEVEAEAEEETNSEEEDGDTTIEVPVDFEEQPENDQLELAQDAIDNDSSKDEALDGTEEKDLEAEEGE